MKYALIALVYLNPEGEKVRIKAGTIFNDAPAEDVERWESRRQVRDATVGEIAEAIAAGKLDPEHAPGAPKKQKTAAEKKAEAAAAQTGNGGAGENSGAAAQTGNGGAGENSGAAKRQALA